MSAGGARTEAHDSPELRASTPELQRLLDEGLGEAETEARRTRREAPAPTRDALMMLVDGASVVDRFVLDLGEALGQVFVAGLAFPDPELADELGELAVRAHRLALVTPVRRTLRLRTMLSALGRERDGAARQALVASAWHECQQLLAWLRMFRIEHDLNVVQARLAARAADQVETPARDVHTETASVWPIGLEMGARGRVVIHACALDDQRPVVLLDELTELDELDPMGRRAISRLFQSDIVLARVMNSVIRLDGHPCVERDDTWLFRPAFNARPELRPVVSSFEPPRPPARSELTQMPTQSADARVSDTAAGPLVRVAARVRRQGRLVRLGAHLSASLQSSAVLDFNLAKLLVREATPAIDLELTVVSGTEPLSVVALETDLDGRSLATVDPTAFVLDPHVLARRAAADVCSETTLAGLWLRTAAALFGGTAEADLALLRHQASRLPGTGIVDAFRAAYARRLLGACPPDDRLPPLVRAALELAATAPDHDVDLDALAAVLGLEHASPADRTRVDGAVVHAAIWLAIELGLVDDLVEPLRTLAATRSTETALQEPSIGEVCARALLQALVALDEADPAPSSDADASDDDDAATALVTDTGVELRPARARTYLDAHLQALGERTRKRRAPMPSMLELLALADVRAMLCGASRHATPLEPLGLPRERLRTLCADALLAWTFDAQGDPAARLAAGDALIVVLAAAMRPWFVAR